MDLLINTLQQQDHNRNTSPHCTLRGKIGPLDFRVQKFTQEPEFHVKIVSACFLLIFGEKIKNLKKKSKKSLCKFAYFRDFKQDAQLFKNGQHPGRCYYLQMVRRHECYDRITALSLNFGLFWSCWGHFWLFLVQKSTF